MPLRNGSGRFCTSDRGSGLEVRKNRFALQPMSQKRQDVMHFPIDIRGIVANRNRPTNESAVSCNTTDLGAVTAVITCAGRKKQRTHEMTTRYAKIAMTLALAAFAFLTVFNNITDYSSNFNFVHHVLEYGYHLSRQCRPVSSHRSTVDVARGLLADYPRRSDDGRVAGLRSTGTVAGTPGRGRGFLPAPSAGPLPA